jgi:peptidoglycan/LPS O-acetylase OafA/YrhL
MKPDPKSRYMPQLDTLRAFAVFLVLLEHWVPEENKLKILPFGMIGVTIFFVLSGFLITGILLKSKASSENNNIGVIHSFKIFYARRTLRIFPVYYVTLLILFILDIDNIREIIIWFLTYTSNFYFYSIQSWVGNISHLWTLAVEEQFYIFWPFVILLTPGKFLIKSIYGIILFSILFRVYMFGSGDGSENTVNFFSILTPACLDSFGLGALLAYFRMNNPDFKMNSLMSKLFLSANVILVIIMLQFGENLLSASVFKFSVSVIALFLISKASIGFTGILKRIFENKILLFLGKISYGLYLFHFFIPLIYNFLKFPKFSNLFLQFAVYSFILVIISSISWYLLEKPVNSLKKYFSYG